VKIIAITDIWRGRVRHAAGSELDLDAARALNLIASGAAHAADRAPADTPPAPIETIPARSTGADEDE
jgi:hypothetical protein